MTGGFCVPAAVWDSSIVVSKMFEWHSARRPGRRAAFNVTGRTCLDLSAGCGLVGALLGRAPRETDAERWRVANSPDV